MPVTSGSAGGLPGMNLVAWVLMKSDGTTIKSFNVSATSRTGAGAYTVTFAAPLATAEYIVQTRMDGLSNLVSTASAKTTAGCSLTTMQGISALSPSDRTALWEFYV